MHHLILVYPVHSIKCTMKYSLITTRDSCGSILSYSLADFHPYLAIKGGKTGGKSCSGTPRTPAEGLCPSALPMYEWMSVT
jgi:hypothetical protein